jgi:hypothetical protein
MKVGARVLVETNAQNFETTALPPRFKVSFERLGEIFAVPLDSSLVAGPQETLFADMLNNDRRPAIAYGKAPNEFFTVWQHNTDINGQRHRLP